MQLKSSLSFLLAIFLTGSCASVFAQEEEMNVRGAFLTTRPTVSATASSGKKTASASVTLSVNKTPEKNTAKKTNTASNSKSSSKKSQASTSSKSQKKTGNQVDTTASQIAANSSTDNTTTIMNDAGTDTSTTSSNFSPFSNSFTNSTYKPEAIGMGYTLYQRDPTGDPVRVDPSTEFRKNDKIRLVFEPNIDGFLYVFYTENDNEPIMLFPDARLRNGNNAVLAHVPYEVPSHLESNESLRWFTFDDKPAVERIYVVVTRQPMKTVPTGEELIKYCQDNSAKTGCTWKVTPDVWQQVKTAASSTNVGVSKVKNYGDRRTSGEEMATTRGLGLSQEAPPPSVIRMNASSTAELLVTKIDLIHK
jgi:hypothetical protein